MNQAARHASERSVFQDEGTGRTIWQLTRSTQADVHTYYDISPWSADQRYIVFPSARAQDLTLEHRDNLATYEGEVYVMDTETFELTRIADRAFYTTHTGAHTMWHPTEHVVYYHRAPDQVAVVDTATTQLLRVMEGGIRQQSTDGTFAYPSSDAGYRDGTGIYIQE